MQFYNVCLYENNTCAYLNECECVISEVWTMMQGHTCMNCVCVCAYALKEEEESWYLSIQVCDVPLKDDICTRCCFFTFEASFLQETPKQQLLQI